jgi:hypothetical protein
MITRRVNFGTIVGLVAQVVFVVAWLIAPLWQGPKYSILAHSISDMYAVTAPGGLFLVVVFTLCGAATIIFLWASVLPTLGSAGWTAVVAVVLLMLSIFGLGDLLTPFERLACRIADPGCTAVSQLSNAGGALDASLSTAGVALFIAGAVFLAVAMNKVTGWKSGFLPMLLFAIAAFVFFIADGVLSSAGLGGLFERLLALAGSAALAWLAARIMRRTAATSSP